MGSMNFKEILELLKTFDKSSLTALKISEGEFSLLLERTRTEQIVEKPATVCKPPVESSQDLSEDAPDDDTVKVTSPIVGTYFEAPQPGATPFVTKGQRVSKGDVLCVIEAMKLVNEIKSPVDGVVSKINVKNGQLMSYGDVIMELSNV